MTKEEAWKIIESVCAKFVGNLEDHKAIQSALLVLKKQEGKDAEEAKPTE